MVDFSKLGPVDREIQFEKLLDDIRANKVGPNLDITDISHKNAARVAGALGTLYRNHPDAKLNLTLQNAHIGDDFFRHIRGVDVKNPNSLTINMPGQKFSAMGHLGLQDAEKRNPGMKFNTDGPRLNPDSVATTTYKIDDYSSGRAAPFDLKDIKQEAYASAYRRETSALASRTARGEFNTVASNTQRPQLGRVYDSTASAPASGGTGRYDGIDVANIRQQVRGQIPAANTSYTGVFAGGVRSFDHYNRGMPVNRYNNAGSDGAMLARGASPLMPRPDKGAPITTHFNHESAVTDMTNSLTNGFYPPGMKGRDPSDPSKSGFPASTLNYMDHNKSTAVAAMPHFERKVTALAAADHTAAMGALNAMYNDSGVKKFEDYIKPGQVRDQHYVDSLKQAHTAFQKENDSPPPPPMARALDAPAEQTAQQKILAQHSSDINSRHESWKGSIASTMQSQHLPRLADRLVSTPQEKWDSIIPKEMSKEDLASLREQVNYRANEINEKSKQVVAHAESLATGQRQDYNGSASMRGVKGENSKTEMRAGPRADHQFNAARGRFANEISREFAGKVGSVPVFREQTAPGQDSARTLNTLIGDQKRAIMEIIPDRKEDLYKTPESVASAMNSVRSRMDDNLNRFQGSASSYFDRKIDAVPEVAAKSELDETNNLTSKAKPLGLGG